MNHCALGKAAAADALIAAEKAGLLTGISYATKDIIATKDLHRPLAG